MRRRTLISLTVLCGLAARPVAQSDAIRRVETGLRPPVIVKGDTAWSLNERMRHYKAPAVSIAVIQDFKIVWAKAYGVIDIETGEAASTETLFQAGSISKPVAAMAALRKVQEGKLSLDEDINQKLTSWKIPENEFTARRKVTLRNLLSHTAGLTVHGFPGYPTGARLPTVPQVLDGTAPANTAPVRVDIEPGTRFRYSGGGTTVVQLALTDTEKKPFPEIVRETVLNPLGMRLSTYDQPLPPARISQAAAGHRPNGEPVKTKRHVYPEMAAAGLWTTATDLATFAIDVQLTLAGRSAKVLAKDMAERMVTPAIESGPGLGFFLDKRGNEIYFGHGGADEGFRAILTVHRDRGYGAVVMVNSDNGQIMDEILRAIAHEYRWEAFLPSAIDPVPVPTSTLDAYTGRYLVNPDRVLTVTREGETLYAQATASRRSELVATSDSTFARKDADVRYTFERVGSGAAARVHIVVGANKSEAARIPASKRIPYERLTSGDVNGAVDAYRELRKSLPASPAVAEPRLSAVGSELLQDKRIAEAIAVFELNVEFHPSSSNAHERLGAGYMASGKHDLAIASYKKSIELNPTNAGAQQMLRKLLN